MADKKMQPTVCLGSKRWTVDVEVTYEDADGARRFSHQFMMDPTAADSDIEEAVKALFGTPADITVVYR